MRLAALHGENDLLTATDKARLAAVLVRRQQLDRAEQLYMEALPILERGLQATDNILRDTLKSLAALKLSRGDHRGAAGLLARVQP